MPDRSTITGTGSREDDLRALIEKKQVVAVVGSGVSIAATGNAATASWKGLLENGIAHCEQFVSGLSKRWGTRQREALEDALEVGDLLEMLVVAEQVSARLGAPESGEFVRWLHESLCAKSLPLKNDAVIHALDALHIPIVTTNYDDLIERATELAGVTWQQKHKIPRIVRDEDRAVLHLHGKWDEPASVILGIRDYEQVKSDEHTQAVLQAFGMARSLLFVGCGEGLDDPNFASFLQWLGRVKASDQYRSYRLALSSEVPELQKKHPPEQRLLVLAYGDDYVDLPGFLESLRAPEPAAPAKPQRETSLSPVLDAYLKRVCEQHGLLPLVGLGASLRIDLPIGDAYVPLHTCFTPAQNQRGRFDRQAFQEAEQMERDVHLEDVFRHAWQSKKRGVLLLGDPGAGKTTGARQLCWRLASGQDAPADLGLPVGTLPVFTRLRNLRPKEVAKGAKSFILGETRLAAEGSETIEAGPELWEFSGSLLWIFDGLDEVVEETARQHVCGWIAETLRDRPRDRILVTSRYQGYEGKVDLGPEFVRFEVQPLEPAQAGLFVHTWYRVAYERLGLDRDAAQDKSRSLVKMLDQPGYRVGRLAELRSNPLLLTILCLVYHDDDGLPRSRVRLYERCVRVLLETWRQQIHTRHGGRPYNPDAARQVLASVAWWMHEEVDRRSVPLAQMEAHAAEQLRLYANSGLGSDGVEFVRLMREDSGIVAASGTGFAEFLHLTFQEYLAASYAVQQNKASELAGAVSQSWWQEVILLALAQATPAFSKDFFERLLKGKTLDDHGGFVERCLQEAEPLVAEPFFAQLRSGKVSQRRRVVLLRHLRSYAFPELLNICRDWTDSSNKELATLSREILQRSGERPDVVVAEAAPSAFVDERTGIAFVRIPVGSFRMGDEKWDHTKPIHSVRITQDFFLGKYPVTNEEYARFLEEKGHDEPAEWSERRFNQPQQPVVGVSWDDAQAFCQWAQCRLPTEAEWEYAYRAGTTTAFSFGDDESELTKFAWYDKNSKTQSQTVGSKKPNPWGLYDMHGNVYEWCQDWYDDGYYRESPENDPPGPDKGKPPSWYTEMGESRVLRGGCWRSVGRECRSGFRSACGPAYRDRFVGFRVVRLRRSGS